jgi:hypothetical protein
MKPKNFSRWVLSGGLLGALLGAATAAEHTPVPDTHIGATKPAVTVAKDEMKSDVYYLASDALQGRGLKTKGLDTAADFIASRFQSLGLKPLPGLDGYFEPFDITTATSIDPSTTLASDDHTYKLKEDYTVLSFSAEKRFAGPVVFAGYGITDTSRRYDDYAGIDANGKVVLVMRFEPHDASGKSRWDPKEYTSNAHLETKARVAEEHGAKALVLVNPPEYHGSDDGLLVFARQFVGGVNIPVLQVKRTVADDLLKRGGAKTLEALQKKIDHSVSPQSVELKDVSMRGNVSLEPTKRTVKNVMAYLPGSGPHADEFVVVGAHYDHLGFGEPGTLMNMPTTHGAAPSVTEQIKQLVAPGAAHSDGDATTQTNPHPQASPHTRPASAPTTRMIHHGADDNASGTATVLELARIFSERVAEHPPERSIIFATFTAEEAGLVGSARFVNHPPIDLKKVVAMLNLDMVGRIRKNLLYVGGGGTATPFHAFLKRADADSPLEFKNFGEGGLGPSDHMSFAVKKVPVLFLFSGIHADYHRPTDTADKINYDGMVDVVKMSVELVDDLLEMPRSQFVDAADKGSMMSPMMSGTGGEAEGRRAALGVIPEYGEEEDGKGVKIAGTSTGTPAEKAGLRSGDVVLKLGDKPTGTLMELSAALAAHKPGDKVKLVYRRGGKEMEKEITLAARGG